MHSPRVACHLQMFNEMDGSIGGTSAAATTWLANVTAYIASIDPHHHMITNSYAEQSGVEVDDKLPHISHTTTHAYEGGDIGACQCVWIRQAVPLGRNRPQRHVRVA